MILHEKLRKKYVCFKLHYYEGRTPRVFTIHDIMFREDSRPRKYMIIGVNLDFNTSLEVDENDADTFDCWDFIEDTYDCIHVYYNECSEQENVKLYNKGQRGRGWGRGWVRGPGTAVKGASPLHWKWNSIPTWTTLVDYNSLRQPADTAFQYINLLKSS